jgi:hypothetical protein
VDRALRIWPSRSQSRIDVVTRYLLSSTEVLLQFDLSASAAVDESEKPDHRYGYAVPRPLFRFRSVGIGLIVALIAAVALSACGSSSTPGLLTQADIPSHLGVRLDQSESAYATRIEPSQTGHCAKIGINYFDVQGTRENDTTRVPVVTKSPEVSSSSLSCKSTSDAQDMLSDGVTHYHERSLSGIGNEAWLANASQPGERHYVVFWRQNNDVGSVTILGTPNDKRITPALAESLARRAAARS